MRRWRKFRELSSFSRRHGSKRLTRLKLRVTKKFKNVFDGLTFDAIMSQKQQLWAFGKPYNMTIIANYLA